jgi:hypothetical protein
MPAQLDNMPKASNKTGIAIDTQTGAKLLKPM